MIKLSKKQDYKEGLEESRKEINEIDDQIVDLLNKRGNIVIKIGNLKKKFNLKIVQPKREIEIIERIKNKSTIFEKEVWKPFGKKL